MEKPVFNITVNGEISNPIQLEYREGQAPKIIEPRKYTVTGIISAPVDFAKTIKDTANSIVEFSLKNKTIQLFQDPTDIHAAEVTGKLELSPEYMEFGINKDKFFDSKQLLKLVRRNAHFFQSLDVAKDLIQRLQNFEVKFEQNVIKTDDRKGGTEDSVKNAIVFSKGELNTTYTLSIPVFTGTEAITFTVELEIENRDSNPVFGFFSIDLEVLINKQIETIMQVETDRLKNKGFVCIQLS